MKRFIALACLLLCGCATVFEGTSQDISVVSNPAGAYCTVERQGAVIATIPNTPATINVPKRKYDLLFRCDKPGYQEATYLNHSGVTAVIAGNIVADVVLTAGLSSLVDSADGADNKYDSVVNMTLLPIVAVQQQGFAPMVQQQGVPPNPQSLCTAQERDQEQLQALLARDRGLQFRGRCGY